MAFLMEADRLKSITRANVLMDLSRPENAAEHSWHIALYALVLAPHAHRGTNIDRVIAMLLLHDLVEIDAGDTPIHLAQDPDQQAKTEARAADRLFGLLPADEGAAFRSLWREFEAAQTPDAIFAKRLDHLQPIFQVGHGRADHIDIARQNLAHGRAAPLRHDWPDAFAAAEASLSGLPFAPTPLGRRLTFLAEADRLKSVDRATRLTDGSRFENSAEHSWHLALFALILAAHAPQGVRIGRVVRMLLLHDLVEIDAGDTPVFGAGADDPAAQAALETIAANRLFGLLPPPQGRDLRTLWDEFEANDTRDAKFAKSLDRFQPPNLNLANGGGSWIDYSVTEGQIRSRIAPKISHGAPELWAWLDPRIRKHFQGSSADA